MSLRIAAAVGPADSALVSRGSAAEIGAASLPAATRDVVDVTFEPAAVGAPIAWVPSPADSAAEVALVLDAERRAEFGDIGHRHDAAACGFCRRAVAAYR